jgi:hypothetical protein
MSNKPTQLNTDLATVCSFSVGNRTKASEAINQAKIAVGIDKHTKSLSEDDKAAIVQWHKERLKDDSQVGIETIAPFVIDKEPAAPLIECPLDTVMPLTENSPAMSELESLRLKNAELQARLDAIEHKAAPTYHINEVVRLGFYVGKKRTVIAISGFYLNALMVAADIDKKGISAWISAAVGSWGGFDDKLNVTEQVKLLIVRELESELIKARG